MQVSWLIESDLFPEYAEKLLAEAIDQGHVAKPVPELPIQYRWEDVGYYYRKVFPQDACVVFHGSIGLTAKLAQDSRWRPGVWCTVENYDCSTYYCHFAQFLLNADYLMLPFGDLWRRREFLFDTLGLDDAIFVRPNSVRKSFTGQVARQDTFDKDVEFMAFYDVPPQSIVLVSSPKQVTHEWRYVIADRKVVTGCLYQVDGEKQVSPEVDPEARELASRVAAQPFQPDRVWIADICRTRDGRYWLLEIGCFNCASLYACDLAAVVREASRIAKEDWEHTQ